MTVLPAINVEDEAEAVEALQAVRDEVTRVHLDVSDGTMTPNRSWRDPARWQAVAGGIETQVHLMTRDPESVIEDWLQAGAREIAVHVEALAPESEDGETLVARLSFLRDACLAHDARLIVCGAYDVPVRRLLAVRAFADGFLVLGVPPGRSGQELRPEALGMARAIREAFEEVPVWFDGGVSAATMPGIAAAGATGVVASSAVFGADDPAVALRALQSA